MQKIRLLVADDDKLSREVFKFSFNFSLKNRLNHNKMLDDDILSQLEYDFEITFCEQAEEAFETVKSESEKGKPFHIIFLDVNMPPGKNGIWAAQKIRELDNKVFIVFITADDEIDVDSIYQTIIPKDKLLFILKPFHTKEIIRLTTSLASKILIEEKVTENQIKIINQLKKKKNTINNLIENSKKYKEQVIIREELYKAIFDNSQIGIMLLHSENTKFGDIVMYNKASQDIIRDLRINSELKNNLFTVFDMIDSDNFIKICNTLQENEWENLNLSFDNKKLNFYFGMVSIGGVKYILVFIKDLTDIETLRSEFVQAQKMEALGRLTSGVAHDFNNMISVIFGFTNVIENLVTDERVKEYLNYITTAATKSKSLTQQLLAFSKKLPTSMQSLDLKNAINELVKILKIVIGASVELIIDLPDDEFWVKADPIQIDQILLNLAINAKDAIPEKGVIRISLSKIEIDDKIQKIIPHSYTGNFIIIKFKDSGIGMDDETAKKIFEPFFTTKDATKGTGLGLATVKNILEAHNGWINVKSIINQGTEFSIYLPDHMVEISKESQKDDLIEINLENETILIVEDDGLLLDMISESMSSCKCNVFTASTITQAKKIFESNKDKITIVLADAYLPDGSGIIFLEDLYAIKPDLELLLTSGFYGNEERQSFIKYLNIPFLRKPFNTKELYKFIMDNKDTKIELDFSKVCELIKYCEFFKNDKLLSNVMAQGWKQMFCYNLKKSNRCKRKQIFLQTGEKPDKDVTPTGQKL